jgi:hypothetical protein
VIPGAPSMSWKVNYVGKGRPQLFHWSARIFTHSESLGFVDIEVRLSALVLTFIKLGYKNTVWFGSVSGTSAVVMHWTSEILGLREMEYASFNDA